MSEHRRRWDGRIRRWPLIVALLIVPAACLRQDTNTGVIIRPSERATASPIAPGIFAVGQTVLRPNGNTVAVIRYAGPFPSRQSGLLVSAADIEGCANPDSPRSVIVSERNFEIELTDKTRRPSTSGDRRAPAFTGKTLRPGRCERGWIHFEYRTGEEPAYVIYQVTPSIRWKIP